MKLGIVLGGLALFLGFSASPSEAQAARRGPPVIRIYSDNGVDYVGTTTYITPRIEVAENAYVFAVEMDMDGQIQVLHPDMPGISVRLLANRSLRLPNFFVGFNSARYGGVSYAGYDAYRGEDSRGTVIALASRAPFNLEKIESYGDWDLAAIRRLIEYRSPLGAAAELARYLGQPGEPIGRDFLRFEGGRSYGYPYYGSGYDYYSPCSAYYGYSLLPGLGFSSLQSFAYFSRLRASNGQVRLVGFDSCGFPIYVSGFAVTNQPQTPIGHFPPPRGHGDTTVFPKSRLPKSPVPRGTTVFANTLEAGIPDARVGSVPQMGDVTIKAAPTKRHYEPGQYIDQYGGGLAVPQGRIPVERVTIPRGEASASGGGARTVPQYHPEPRVETAPARAPERTSAPVIERPSSPPPPPPRGETSSPKSEPARTPPPSRGH